MLKIRLQRVGRVHEPSFRLVLTDLENSTKSGRFKEVLGSYDPRKSTDSLNTERIRYWLSQGASPTNTVHNLLVRHRIINAKKIDVSAKSKKAPSSAEATEDKPVAKVEEKAVQEEVVETPKAQADVIVEEAPTSAEGEVEVPTDNVGEEKTV